MCDRDTCRRACGNAGGRFIQGRLNVPSLEGPIADELKSKLYPGAAVGNPIDIIGTGTPEHLATAIDFCENRFDNVDLMMVIFGSPGLVKLL